MPPARAPEPRCPARGSGSSPTSWYLVPAVLLLAGATTAKGQPWYLIAGLALAAGIVAVGSSRPLWRLGVYRTGQREIVCRYRPLSARAAGEERVAGALGMTAQVRRSGSGFASNSARLSRSFASRVSALASWADRRAATQVSTSSRA